MESLNFTFAAKGTLFKNKKCPEKLTPHGLWPIASEDELLEGCGSWLIQTAPGLLHEDIGTSLESNICQMLTDQTNNLVISRRQVAATTFHFSNESRRRHKRFVGRRGVVVLVVTARTDVGCDVTQRGLINGGSIIGASLPVSTFLKSHFSRFGSVVEASGAHGRREFFAAVEVWRRRTILVNHATRWAWTGLGRAATAVATLTAVTPDPLSGRGLLGRHERGAQGARAGRCCTPGCSNKATSSARDGKRPPTLARLRNQFFVDSVAGLCAPSPCPHWSRSSKLFCCYFFSFFLFLILSYEFFA